MERTGEGTSTGLQGQIKAWLGTNHPHGSVQAIFAEDSAMAERLVRDAVASQIANATVVTRRWDGAWSLRKVLRQVVNDLEQTIQERWPFWFGAERKALWVERPSELETVQAGTDRWRQVDLGWLAEAWRLASQGHRPGATFRPLGAHAEQLSRCLGRNELVVIWTVAEPGRAFADAALWLARKTEASVAVILPLAAEKSPELDGITYGAIFNTEDGSNHVSPAQISAGDRESSFEVWPPIEGRPHFASPGEQLLCRKLQEDPELRGLFGCNRRVRMFTGREFIADFLWTEGRCAVEVDGYRYHGNRAAFADDRQRDFEFLITGYLVLRIPHDEVIADASRALEKVRRLVHFRSETLPQT